MLACFAAEEIVLRRIHRSQQYCRNFPNYSE